MSKLHNIKLIAVVLTFSVATVAMVGGQASAAVPQTSSTQTSSDGWYFYTALNEQMRDHVTKSIPALRADIDNTADEAALKAAVDANSAQIADIVEQKYPGTHDEFQNLWLAQSRYFHEYVRAKVQRDSVGQVRAKSKMNAFSYRVSDLLNASKPELDQSKLQQQMYQHGLNMTAIINNYASNRDANADQLAAAEKDYMTQIAQTMSFF